MHDYIVIGSGPSGGNVAGNLFRAGADVLLLEAGKLFSKETFPRREAETSAKLYWGGGIEFDTDAKMGFLRARVVGGTSIVNQCLLDRFDDIAFNDWKAESGVDWFGVDEMAPYYQTIEDRLSLHTFVPDDFNRNAELFTQSCEKVGVKWGALRKGQDDCAHGRGNDCIACLGGCHRDSKQSSYVGFIRDAVKDGLNLQSETEVQHIEHTVDVVTIYALQKGKQVVFKAKNLVLAGGAFGTTSMLLRSGFGKKLPALGKNFSSHPQFMSFGLLDEEVKAHKGYFQTVASKDPNLRQKGYKLENVFAPPISAAMLFSKTGTYHQDIMRNYNRMTCIEVAVRDENAGEIKTNNKGRLVVDKPFTSQDRRRRDEGRELIKEILINEGAKKVYDSPFAVGLHLMGGAVIGVDPVRSVVDPEFRVHGTQNMFIADSSIYPNAPGINPSLTIMALAQKLSNQLTGEHHFQTTTNNQASVIKQ